MTDGVKGGDVNRPGSRPEIDKLPRGKCVRCGLISPAPIVVNSKCRNERACALRVERAASQTRKDAKP